MRWMWVAVLAAAMAGCATASPDLSSRLLVSDAVELESGRVSIPETPAVSSVVPSQSLEWSRRKTTTTGAQTLEAASSKLAVVLAQHAGELTAQSEVAVGQAYLLEGVLDLASEHFAAAAKLNPREGASWDGLARIWRGWGFPQFGLGDAHRAVFAAPSSAEARNTLGTILQTLGKSEEAREQFRLASGLNPRAAYALNNLCFSWLSDGDADAAIAECTRALDIDPNLRSARWNLKRAREMSGRRSAADAAVGQSVNTARPQRAQKEPRP